MFEEGTDAPAPPLYTDNDPVTILDDASFIGTQGQIKSRVYQGPGVLKCYAPWCGHCKAKVECCNRLAEALQEHGMQVYVIDGTANPVFSNFREVTGFPTFFRVGKDGLISGPLEQNGEPVYGTQGLVKSICQDSPAVCTLISELEACQK